MTTQKVVPAGVAPPNNRHEIVMRANSKLAMTGIEQASGMSRYAHVVAIAVAALAFSPWLHAAPVANPVATPESTQQIPAVALSYDGQHLAWIQTRNGTRQPMLASWTGKNAHAIAIPGDCGASGLRWAPRWNTLAVMTRCTNAAASHGAIWIVDVHGGTAPRKIANIDGYASAMQWKNTGKTIAFLYRPPAAAGNATPAPQVVAAVGTNGGPFQILTPGNWYVHAFRLSRIGNAMAFTATTTAGEQAPTLYALTASGPKVIFDPAKATGALHGLRISLLRYPAYLIGFLGHSPGAAGADIYTVAPTGGQPVNRTASNKIKPTWFTLNRHQVITTRVVNGQVQLVKYRMGFSWVRPDRLWFSLPGTIGDGRAPSGVSLSYYNGWRHVAFVQSVAGHAPVIRSGLLSTQPPPVVASASMEVANIAR